MAGGLLLTRLAKLAHLPNVTAYLVAGLIVGPYCLKLLPSEAFDGLNTVTAVALGFIAFSIGSEFKLSSMRSLGTKVLVITLFQAFGAVILVDAALLLAGVPTPMALTLGAIATATAPAATLMVVRQYKAKGELTNTLLPVVAMDDAVGLIVFAVSVSAASMIESGAAFSVYGTIIKPVLEIVLSLLAGAAAGLLAALSHRLFKSRANRLCVCIALIFACVALAKRFDLSDLLVCMAAGAVYVNLRDDAIRTLERMDEWTPPLYLLFFVISGAELDIAALPAVGLAGVIYIAARSLGKYGGAYLGAAVTKANANVRRYLGVTLLPQAGVAIGMAQLAITQLPEYGAKIQAIALCATLVYELVGPVCTKLALTKAGEITPEPKKAKAPPTESK